MQLEIELKAWVHDLPGLQKTLIALGADRLRDYRKEDQYLRHGNQDVRIRQDGHEAIVTFKDKQLVNGLEINEEHEFTVSDPEAMAELLLRMGATRLVKKIKIGQAWELSGLLLEVSEIVGLGHFIELERVIELPGSDPMERARITIETDKLIRLTLASLGIPESAIEAKTYTSLLLAQKYHT